MDMKELQSILTKQLEENHTLLQQNNLLLHQILEQDKLVFKITQANIQAYGYHWYFGENPQVKKLRKELDALQKKLV